jgi:hypothetical protein
MHPAVTRFNERPPRTSVDRFGRRILFLFILSGFPLLIWATYGITTDTYAFWKHGVEKRALVVEMENMAYVYKGGTMFYYVIEFDGHRSTEIFRMRLPEGKYVPILVLPGNPEKVALGRRDSSMFDIYTYEIGGRVYAVLTLCMFAFMTICGPLTIRQFWKNRRKIFEY